MIQLITPDRYGDFVDDLAEMRRLRYRVFKERLAWSVRTVGDTEVDEFDALNPVYLLQRNADGIVQGCVRLLSSTGPTMLRDVFSVLLAGQPAPANPAVWESSRFALDIAREAPKAAGGLAQATYELFAGMVAFGLSRDLSEIVTVTDIRMERILRRASWPLHRLGASVSIDGTGSVAGFLEVSEGALRRLRDGGGLRGPILWAPITVAAA